MGLVVDVLDQIAEPGGHADFPLLGGKQGVFDASEEVGYGGDVVHFASSEVGEKGVEVLFLEVGQVGGNRVVGQDASCLRQRAHSDGRTTFRPPSTHRSALALMNFSCPARNFPTKTKIK